jgi:hypothetical protein
VAGPILRDWVIAMSGVPADQTAEGAIAPMYFNAHLPIRAGAKPDFREGRHVVLALKEKDKPLAMHFHLFLYNMGTKADHAVTVFGPDGSKVSSGQFTSNVVLKMGPMSEGGSVEMPAEKPAGVYVFLLRSIAPIRAQASSGKVVHYLPEGPRSIVSPHGGSRAWFMPRGGGEVSIGFPLNLPCGRMVILDPEGKVAASSRITGTSERKLWLGVKQQPVTGPCRLEQALIKPGLYSFLSGCSDFKDYQEIRGMKPWLASTREEWFDPTAHGCPDVEAVLAATLEPVGSTPGQDTTSFPKPEN